MAWYPVFYAPKALCRIFRFLEKLLNVLLEKLFFIISGFNIFSENSPVNSQAHIENLQIFHIELHLRPFFGVTESGIGIRFSGKDRGLRHQVSQRKVVYKHSTVDIVCGRKFYDNRIATSRFTWGFMLWIYSAMSKTFHDCSSQN